MKHSLFVPQPDADLAARALRATGEPHLLIATSHWRRRRDAIRGLALPSGFETIYDAVLTAACAPSTLTPITLPACELVAVAAATTVPHGAVADLRVLNRDALERWLGRAVADDFLRPRNGDLLRIAAAGPARISPNGISVPVSVNGHPGRLAVSETTAVLRLDHVWLGAQTGRLGLEYARCERHHAVEFNAELSPETPIPLAALGRDGPEAAARAIARAFERTIALANQPAPPPPDDLLAAARAVTVLLDVPVVALTYASPLTPASAAPAAGTASPAASDGVAGRALAALRAALAAPRAVLIPEHPWPLLRPQRQLVWRPQHLSAHQRASLLSHLHDFIERWR